MGDIKRKRKKYSKPKKLYDKQRIEEENVLVKKYGLKNKREIWKAKSVISKIRRRAKNLIGKSDSEQAEFFNKLHKNGFKVETIADVLALNEEDLLKRRLQTFVFKKGLANSPKQARQLIVHKHIAVGGDVVNAPSFVATTDLEDKIEFKVGREVKESKVKKEKVGGKESKGKSENKSGDEDGER